MKEPLLAKIIRYGIYALAFIPLIIFSDYLSPFHFGKAIIFRSVVEILGVLYAILALQDRRYRPRLTLTFWSVTAFVALYGLTTFTGVDVAQSFWGSLERMGGFYSLIHFWIFFVLLLAFFRTRKDWVDLIRLSIVVTLLGAAYGFLQKTSVSWVIGSGGRNKIFGTLGNPALFAGYQLFGLFWSLIFFFRKSTTRNGRYFYGISAVINAVAIVLSGVRGSVAGMVIGVVLFLLGYSLMMGSQKMRRFSYSAIILMVVIIGLLWSLRNSDFVKNDQYLARYSDFSPSSYTVQTRTWTWKSGLEGWIETPKSILLGYGPENFNIPFSHHFDPRHFLNSSSETLFDRAHNMFIEVLVTMGLIGEASYLILLGFPLYGLFQIIRKQRHHIHQAVERDNVLLATGLIATLIAYMIHNFFIFDTTANYLVFFITLGLIDTLIHGDDPLVPQDHHKGALAHNHQTLSYALGIGLAVIAGYSIYAFNVLPTEANYATTRGIVLGWDKQNDAAIAKFKQALEYGTPIAYDIRNRYDQYIIDLASNGGKIPDNVKQGLLLALEYEKKNADEHPTDYIPLLYISRMNILLGKDDPKSPYNDIALENSLAALKISPTFVRTYFEVAQAYLNKKDYGNALQYFREAVRLNPKAGISNWYLGSALLEAGKQDEGLTYLQTALSEDYQPGEYEYLRLINIFVQRKDAAHVLSTYQALVRSVPDNAQYRASLAAAYAQVGDIDHALEEARMAVKIDPSFENEARAFAKALGRDL